MQYYFLRGLEKVGPHTMEELKSMSLTPETIVYTDGLDNWKPIKEIPELNEFLFKKGSDRFQTRDELKKDNSKIENIVKLNQSNTKTKKNGNGKIKIPSLILLIIFYMACIAGSYYITLNQQNNDRDKMNSEIDKILSNKDAIIDYKQGNIDGRLYDVYLSNSWGFNDGDKNVIRTSQRILAHKPIEDNTIDNKFSYYSEQEQKGWDLFKDLVEYYESRPFRTGFNILKLERYSSVFKIIESWSGDMGYKVGKSTHVQGYQGEFYSSPGYDIPTNRPSVNDCYEEAAKYLTSEKENKFFEAGSYNKISSFPDLETNFFRIYQNYPRYYLFLDTIKVDNGINRESGYVINNSKITDATSAGDANVFTSQWIVWYKSYVNTYSVEEKEGIFNKYWSIYSSICITIITLFYFGIKFRNRIILK